MPCFCIRIIFLGQYIFLNKKKPIFAAQNESKMASMTIEYNEKNRHVMQVLSGLIGAGVIHRRNGAEISDFKTALQEAKTISIDIAQNGIAGYKTLDDLLIED